jgi:hypothetical protein
MPWQVTPCHPTTEDKAIRWHYRGDLFLVFLVFLVFLDSGVSVRGRSEREIGCESPPSDAGS